jgi:uncharacterized protein (DUF433 family)
LDVTLQILEKEMFSEAEAARLLQVPQATLHWWLEGGERGGREYRPVVRVNPKGTRSVSWAEFIESGLLVQYRRVHRVSLGELRTVIDILRDKFGAPYPLAHHKPFIGEGRKLLLEAQDRAQLDPELCLVAVASGEPVLTPPSESFVQRVDWDDDLAVAWKPHIDPKSPVRMKPDVRFGLPAIRGIKTEVIWEHIEADEGFADVAAQFDLSVEDVRWAYAYENSVRAA